MSRTSTTAPAGPDGNFGSAAYNDHQLQSLQAYGSGQAAVDFMLAQRYGGMPSAGTGPEGFGQVTSGPELEGPRTCCPVRRGSSFPSVLDLRYRGL